jgi:hypothetical protein
MPSHYVYHPQVLEALLEHGVRPTPTTPPALVRSFVSDLYRWEIRRLRARLLARAFPKHEYVRRVIELRRRYFVLSVPIESWVERGVVR